MNKKRYLLLGGTIFILVLAIALTYSLIYYRTETTGINLIADTNISPYINYENGTPILSSANATLNAGTTYASGLSTEIEFWKATEARNMVLYGHIFLDINTGSSNLLGEPGLKWAVVSDNTVLGQGNFTTYTQGDSIPMYINFELSATETHYQIYVWLDQSVVSGDIADETLKVTVRCEASTGTYDQTYIERVNADVINIGYTGSIDTYVVPRDGTYKLEVWGAQGGNTTYGANSYNGGYGGYSVGTITLHGGDTLYTVVGAAGESVSYVSSVTHDSSSGYNGGGYGTYYSSKNNVKGGGGGATHIATASGLLKDLSDKKSSVIIVAGGGGGSSANNNAAGNYSGTGGYGGGAVGGPGVPANTTCYGYGLGGTQTEAGGYTQCAISGTTYGTTNIPVVGGFGLGYNYTEYKTGNYIYAGGGGGYYGGRAGYYAPGGGGSSYVGSLTGGKMYCFGCTEDTSNNTYTTTDASESAISNTAKIGNGYARITRIS